MEEFLKISHPKIIIASYNPIFPPPVSFMQSYDANDEHPRKAIFGSCSLSKMTDIAEKYNYKLVQTEFFDAYFVRTEIANVLGNWLPNTRAAWEIGFYQTPFLDIAKKVYKKFDRPVYIPKIEEWINNPNTEDIREFIKSSDSYDGSQFEISLDFGEAPENNGRKKFIYLGMYSGVAPDYYNDLVGSNSDLMWLTYKEAVPGAIFFPNSSWAQGRNRLYREALEKEKRQGWRYLYYIFFDGDVRMGPVNPWWNTTVSGWRKFEEFLLNYEPAIGLPDFRYTYPKDFNPGYTVKTEVCPMYHYDAIVNAFHREAAEVVLPYDESWDHISWWYTQLALIYKSYVLFRKNNMEHYFTVMWNTEHNPYPQEDKFDETLKQWSAVAIPDRVRNCLLGFWTMFGRCAWGGPRSKKIVRYDGLTLYNVDPCVF